MSNTVNYVAIATALALRFSATNVTAPTGEPALRSSLYLPPAGIHPPCVVVFPPEENNLSYYPGMMVTSDQVWPVRFYIADPSDYARQVERLLKWRQAIYASLDGHIQLGLDYVNSATVVGIRSGELPFDTEPGAHGYPGIEILVNVQTRDSRSFTA